MMRILLFGATGMVGNGVLRWLIASPDVDSIVAVSRRPLSLQSRKLEVVIETDMFHLMRLEELTGFDACFFCLGASSVGMTESEYRYVTYDLTLAVARQLLTRNPRMVFEYISGGRAALNGAQMWLRVKAETEQGVFKVGFTQAYALRPGFIQPMRGVRSRHQVARWIYTLTAAVYPALQKRFERAVTSTDLLACAMLKIARAGYSKRIVSNQELNQVARAA